MAAFQLARKAGKAVADPEELGWTPFMPAIPRYNQRMLNDKILEVKMILSQFTYPYDRRIAGAHANFSKQDYKKWLQQVNITHLAAALRRLAQLKQTKAYLLWKRH